jgi:hypothetical protein
VNWPATTRDRSEATNWLPADHERTLAQSVVHVQGKHGHREADDEKSDKDDADDRADDGQERGLPGGRMGGS